MDEALFLMRPDEEDSRVGEGGRARAGGVSGWGQSPCMPCRWTCTWPSARVPARVLSKAYCVAKVCTTQLVVTQDSQVCAPVVLIMLQAAQESEQSLSEQHLMDSFLEGTLPGRRCGQPGQDGYCWPIASVTRQRAGSTSTHASMTAPQSWLICVVLISGATLNDLAATYAEDIFSDYAEVGC
jgi:hypothetical protein